MSVSIRSKMRWFDSLGSKHNPRLVPVNFYPKVKRRKWNSKWFNFNIKLVLRRMKLKQNESYKMKIWLFSIIFFYISHWYTSFLKIFSYFTYWPNANSILIVRGTVKFRQLKFIDKILQQMNSCQRSTINIKFKL